MEAWERDLIDSAEGEALGVAMLAHDSLHRRWEEAKRKRNQYARRGDRAGYEAACGEIATLEAEIRACVERDWAFVD